MKELIEVILAWILVIAIFFTFLSIGLYVAVQIWLFMEKKGLIKK